MKLRRAVRPMGGALDMTALINCVLLLLFFFMLSTSFVLQPGIKVNPPRGLQAGVRDVRTLVTVTAQEPPLIFFNDQLTTVEGVRREFARMGRQGRGREVILRADRDVKHGVVVELMNEAIQAGLSVVIATQPEREQSQIPLPP